MIRQKRLAISNCAYFRRMEAEKTESALTHQDAQLSFHNLPRMWVPLPRIAPSTRSLGDITLGHAPNRSGQPSLKQDAEDNKGLIDSHTNAAVAKLAEAARLPAGKLSGGKRTAVKPLGGKQPARKHDANDAVLEQASMLSVQRSSHQDHADNKDADGSTKNVGVAKLVEAAKQPAGKPSGGKQPTGKPLGGKRFLGEHEANDGSNSDDFQKSGTSAMMMNKTQKLDSSGDCIITVLRCTAKQRREGVGNLCPKGQSCAAGVNGERHFHCAHKGSLK